MVQLYLINSGIKEIMHGQSLYGRGTSVNDTASPTQ